MNNSGTTPPTDSAPLTTPPPISAENKTLGGIGSLTIFLLVSVVLLFLVQLAGIGIAALVFTLNNDGSGSIRSYLEQLQFNAFVVVPVQLAVFAALAGWLYFTVKVVRGLPFRAGLALRPVSMVTAGTTIGMGFLLAIVVNVANAFFPPTKELGIEKLFTSRDAALLILGLAILAAPLMEELFFRGYIYTLLERLWGQTPAILTSGLLFGTIHIPQLWPGYFQIATLGVVGIVLSLVRARTGNTTAAILMHLGYNATLSAGFLLSPEFQKLAFFLF